MKDEPRTLEAQREQERRLALLALAGGSKPAGPCPDAETLAALVEGRLAPEQLDACLGHLAGCDACTALWLQLDQEWRQSTGKPRSKLRQFLARPRVLAAAGSLLGAAASIAVFLNLTLQADRHDLLRLPEQSAREQMRPAPAPQSIEQTTGANETAERPAEPAAPAQEPPPATPMETMTQGAASGKKVEREAATRKQKAAENKATPLVAPAAKTVKPTEEAQDAAGRMKPAREKAIAGSAEPASVPQEAAMQTIPAAPAPATPAITSIPSLEDWRRTLRHDCRGQADRQQFVRLQAQGQALLRHKGHALAQADRLQLERLLALLAEPLPIEAQCRAILAELGPADDR